MELLSHLLPMTLGMLCILPGPVTPFIDQICVNVGYENMRNKPGFSIYSLNKGNYEHFQGVSKHNLCQALFYLPGYQQYDAQESGASIGGKKFGSADKGSVTLSFNKDALGLLPLPPGMKFDDCSELNDTSKADISTFGVKHNGKYLNGWMGIEIFIKEEVVWSFIQVSDEKGNAIGEFVTEPVEHTCGQPAPESMTATPKTEQFLPCTATGLQEAKSSQGFVYMRKDLITENKGKPDLADQYMGSPKDPSGGLKMRLTWRLNEYFCNRHAKFRVVAYFLTKQSSEDRLHPVTIFQRGDWLYPKWYGAADVILKSSSSSVECNPSDKIDQQFLDKNEDFWISRTQPFNPLEDNIKPESEGPNFPDTLYKSCRTYLTRLFDYSEDVKRQPSYGGRCEKIDEKKFKPEYYKTKRHSSSSVDVPHQCLENREAEYPPEMEDYKDYMEKKMKARKSLCSEKAQKCPNLEELTQRTIAYSKAGADPPLKPNATGRYIMKSRAYHGAMFTWCALFFIPISNFMARFFKETFLADDIIGIRVWYFVHIGFFVMVLNFSVSGLVANGKVTRTWGRSWSQAGAIHRGLGWFSCVLYVIVALLGPFRPEPQRARLAFMIVHSLLGYLQYFMGLITVMTSALIPGSPSATTCYKKMKSFDPFYRPSFRDMYNHKISTAVTWWICLDFLFYGLMSLMQRAADRSWDVQRRHYIPLVPIVGVDDRKSFKCFRYRTMILIIYVFILSIIAIVTTDRLYKAEWKGCDVGTMTCTHVNIRAETAYKESQCGMMAAVRKKKNG